MTREEAIESLNNLREIGSDEAIDMAIEALKSEPNTSDRSDLISREDAMKAICEVCLDGESLYKGCKHHWNCPYLTKIGKIPTVSADRETRGNGKREENNNVHKVPLYAYTSWERSEE